MNNTEKIILKYNQFLNDFPEKKQFYQIKSLYNFLVHIDEIKNEVDKLKIFEILNEYLDYITYHNIETKDECKELYFKFIHPIGVLYTEHAGFTQLFRYQSVLIVLALIDLMLLIFYLNVFSTIIINVLGTGIVLYLFKKSKTTKVFGINW